MATRSCAPLATLRYRTTRRQHGGDLEKNSCALPASASCTPPLPAVGAQLPQVCAHALSTATQFAPHCLSNFPDAHMAPGHTRGQAASSGTTSPSSGASASHRPSSPRSSSSTSSHSLAFAPRSSPTSPQVLARSSPSARASPPLRTHHAHYSDALGLVQVPSKTVISLMHSTNPHVQVPDTLAHLKRFRLLPQIRPTVDLTPLIASQMDS